MSNPQTLRIALGDLRHRTVGRHSAYMPIGIGYIASYMLSHVDSKNIEVRFYNDAEIILRDIDLWKPTVIGLSNYCWNSELSRLVFRYAKKANPDVVCIAGGPEFPTEHADCKEYLWQRKGIDFYVYLEGEVAFTNLICKVQKGIEVSALKREPQGGIMSIHPEAGELVAGEPIPRLMNLDEIPSPYLNGLMDPWFNGHYIPSTETARGCPFTCGYCHTGQSWYNTLAKFSPDRVKAELTYIARRMAEHSDIPLTIYDNNFGIFERDEIIAGHLRSLYDEFGWPKTVDAGIVVKHGNRARAFRMASLLSNRMRIACSVQSLNSKTLDVVKRKNLPMDEYEEIQNEIKRRGMRSVAELIVPMPEETKTSFFDGVRAVTNAGVEVVFAYTTMLLKGTYLNSQECREKYQMQTKFRLVPRQFGEYVGKKCFEIEEVCVATNTMSFEDYLDCRGFSLILSLLCHEQFDFIARHLKELGISRYDYLYYVWDLIRSGKTDLLAIYDKYIEETKNELWDNMDSLYEYFTRQENYERLLTGELGDNLFRKYRTKFLLECCIPTIELAYFAIQNVGRRKLTQEIQDSLDAAKRWMITTRNISAIFRGDLANEILKLPYDVNSWYIAGDRANSLTSYNTSVNYKIFCDVDEIEKILADVEKLFGEDLSYRAGKLLIHWDVSNFWRKCELVTEGQREKSSKVL